MLNFLMITNNSYELRDNLNPLLVYLLHLCYFIWWM